MNKQFKTAEVAPETESVATVPLGRRERAKKEKLRRIMEAARHLFETQGFEKTTTQQIADTADIGTGTLFLYTESKENLLVMVFERDMQEQASRAFARVSDLASPVDQVCSVFSEMMDYHENDMGISEVLIKNMVISDSDEHRRAIHGELMATVLNGLEKIVIAAREMGIFPQHLDPNIAARSMFSCYHLGAMQWLIGLDTREVLEDRLRPQCAQIIDPNGKSFVYGAQSRH